MTIAGQRLPQRLPVRFPFEKLLPHEQASTGTGGPIPPYLDGLFPVGKRLTGVRAREFRPRSADLFDLYSTMAVHNLSCRLRLVARTGRKDHDSSAPYSLNIVFCDCFDDPESLKITNQTHFKIRVWRTHEPTAPDLPRLA